MIPVTLVTGFLGAGKTTLLNHVLREPHGLRLAVLVNDFGSVNIDAELLRESGEEILALENGCICCSLGAGLLATLARVVRRPDPPDRILVEASGVSDPAEIAATLADPELRPYAPLDGIVTVVDAEAAPNLCGASRALAERQAAMASLIVLNKTDLAPDPSIARGWVRALAPDAGLVETSHSRVSLAAMTASRTGPVAIREPAAAPHGLQTGTFESHDPVPLRRLHGLLGSLSGAVLRVKGVLNLIEQPRHRCILQMSGHRATITVGGPWGDVRPKTQIVVIGTGDFPDPQAFEAALMAEPDDGADMDVAEHARLGRADAAVVRALGP